MAKQRLKALYLAGGQQRLAVSSRKLLALGQVGGLGSCTELGDAAEAMLAVLPAPGLLLQTKELWNRSRTRHRVTVPAYPQYWGAENPLYPRISTLHSVFPLAHHRPWRSRSSACAQHGTPPLCLVAGDSRVTEAHKEGTGPFLTHPNQVTLCRASVSPAPPPTPQGAHGARCPEAPPGTILSLEGSESISVPRHFVFPS